MIDKSIEELNKYRIREGEVISKDLKKSISKIDNYIKKITSIEPSRMKDKKKSKEILNTALALMLGIVKREEKKLQQLRELLTDSDVQETLRDIKHPRLYRARQGMTYYDYTQWMIRCAGKTGKLKMLKEINKILDIK